MACCNKEKEEQEVVEEEEDDRGEWANPIEFILSCLGYAVGLGNVWRFPYLCYENGGGAFLIPYTIMLTFVGIPCFMIELSLGQYAGAGPITVWTVSPLFRGIGVGMMIISFIGCIYYNMIIGWAIYYIAASFQKELPWSHCRNDFNTDYCYSKTEAEDGCEEKDGSNIFFNQTCYTDEQFDAAMNITNYTCYYWDVEEGITFEEAIEDGRLNDTDFDAEMPCDLGEYVNENYHFRTGASEEYFNLRVLDRSERMEDADYLIWELVLVLLLAWILCYFSVIKGIKSSGKVVYFTATFPYVILVILFIRGILLEGALDGIKFYIIPDWERLKTPKVWGDAAGQIFFSLSVGFGGLMTFASYNRYHNNIYRDTLIVAISNCLTSFFAGFVIFSILGHLAYVLDREVKDVATSGSGLAFIAYPEIVTYLPVSQLWSVLFFFMLLTLGLDSQFAGLENLMTAFVDTFPKFRNRKWLVSLVLCTILFISGFSMCTRAGFYWEELMGYYSSGWSLVLIGLAESSVIAYAYGARQLMVNIQDMVGFKLNLHWWVCWTFITPPLLIAILIFNFVEFTPLAVGEYVLPDWAQGIGWLMAVAPVVMVPIVAVWVVYKSYADPCYANLSFGWRLVKLTKPTEEWKTCPERRKGRKQTDDAEFTDAFNIGQQNGGTYGSPPPYNQYGVAGNAISNPGFGHVPPGEGGSKSYYLNEGFTNDAGMSYQANGIQQVKYRHFDISTKL